MELRDYLSPLSPYEREAFAHRCGTTMGHLRNVMGGSRKCSTLLAASIERESGAAVRRWNMRADDWHRIWPELVGSEGAPVSQEA